MASTRYWQVDSTTHAVPENLLARPRRRCYLALCEFS